MSNDSETSDDSTEPCVEDIRKRRTADNFFAGRPPPGPCISRERNCMINLSNLSFILSHVKLEMLTTRVGSSWMF